MRLRGEEPSEPVLKFWSSSCIGLFTEVLLPTFPELISGAENFGPVVLCLRGYGRRLGRWVAVAFRFVKCDNLPTQNTYMSNRKNPGNTKYVFDGHWFMEIDGNC